MSKLSSRIDLSLRKSQHSLSHLHISGFILANVFRFLYAVLFRIFSLLMDALRESEAGMETKGADFCIFIFLKFGADS